MGDVTISPNLKKKAVRIDLQGNTFDPKTKEVVLAEPEYVPPTPPAQPVEAPKPSGIQSKIEAKIEEIINRKIEEALNKLL